MMRYATSSWIVLGLFRILFISKVFTESEWPENYNLKDGERFDFIVVGSGSAGAIVAARLSEVPSFNVLLIEAGGDPPVASVIPGLLPLLQNTEYDWNFKAYTDAGIGETHPDRMIPYSRGKLLGGCSSTNYLIYARGVPQDYDEWDKVAPGWNWDNVLYYFKKLEGMTDLLLFKNPQNAHLHSTDGPVNISRTVKFASTAEIDDIRLNSFEEIGIKRVLEINGPEILGAARPHLTINNGRRSSTAEAYLKPAKDRPNLRIAKFSIATKILIDQQSLKAYGVEVAAGGDNIIQVFATNEVIISAGVINSPKILLHSGIGPHDVLSKFDIETLVDLPVGKNFHDHQVMLLSIKGKPGLSSAIQNILLATNLDTVPLPIQSGHFRISESIDSYPNILQPHFQFFNSYIGAGAAPAAFIGCKTIPNFEDQYCTSLTKANVLNDLDNIMLVLLHPLSRGEVLLRSKDPFADPIINLGYFRNEYDVMVAAKGLKYMSSLVNSTYFKQIGSRVMKLKARGCKGIKWGTEAYWRCYAKSTVTSILHGVGTCSMGFNGVVNERLKVHNVEGLRVVDASVIPKIPSGNTNAPVMMIGEKAADMIKAEYGVLKSGFDSVFNNVF